MTDSERSQLGRMEGKLDVLVVQFGAERERVTDHEQRLRALERWRYALPTSLIIAVGSALVAALGVIV